MQARSSKDQNIFQSHFRLLIICLILALPRFSYAQFFSDRFDLSLGWEEITTEHFHILYPIGYKSFGFKASQFAEEVHKKIVPILGVAPKVKTVIILSDQQDDHNGWATIYPYQQINVRLSPPDLGSVLGEYDNWLYSTILHEYTHILNLIPASGFFKFLQFVFGPIVVPNGALPRWHLEGLAVYSESKFSNEGRGDGTYFNMILRSAVNENLLGSPKFASVDQLNENLPWWPHGNAPYLFGYEFYDYMVDNFGHNFIKEFNLQNSGRIPYTFEGLTKRLSGGDSSSTIFGKIWKKLESKFRPQITKIKKAGVTEVNKITDRDTTIVGPQYSPNGKILAFFEYSPHAPGALKFYMVNENREVIVKEAGEIKGANQLGWSPDGNKIIFTQRVKWNYFYDIRDLYEFDLKNAKLTRLTWGLRGDYSAYSHDGKEIYFVHSKDGFQNIAKVNSAGNELVEINKGNQFANIASTRVWGNKNEEFIVFVVKDENGQQDIWIEDLKNGATERLTNDWFEEQDTVWSADGNLIIYSSDLNGVKNIYAMDRKTGAVNVLTNVIGGAFQPTISPDNNKMAFVDESTKGLNLVETNFSPKPIVPTKALAEKNKFSDSEANRLFSKFQIKGYSPIYYLFPKWWLPWADLSQNAIRIGGITGGEDPLGEWNYVLNAGYDSLSQRVNWSALLGYYRFPTIITGFYENFTFLISELNVLQEERKGNLSFSIPMDKILDDFWIQPRGLLRRVSFTNIPLPDVLFIGGGIGASYGHILKFPYSVTREQGISFEGSIDRFETASKLLPYSYWFAQSSLSGYIPINFPTQHSVLAARTSFGWTQGAPIEYAYFQVGGEVPYIFQGGQFLVRGYSINQYVGQRPVVGNLEWRIPVSQLWRGLSTLPVFLRQVYAVPFYDVGTPDYSQDFLLQGTGGELRFNFTLGYQAEFGLRVGVYRGLTNGGRTMGYVGIAEEF